MCLQQEAQGLPGCVHAWGWGLGSLAQHVGGVGCCDCWSAGHLLGAWALGHNQPAKSRGSFHKRGDRFRERFGFRLHLLLQWPSDGSGRQWVWAKNEFSGLHLQSHLQSLCWGIFV